MTDETPLPPATPEVLETLRVAAEAVDDEQDRRAIHEVLEILQQPPAPGEPLVIHVPAGRISVTATAPVVTVNAVASGGIELSGQALAEATHWTTQVETWIESVTPIARSVAAVVRFALGVYISLRYGGQGIS